MLQLAIDSATVWQSWTILLVFFVDIIRCCGSAADTWQDLKLPDEHIPYFFNNNNHLRTLCEIDTNCPHKKDLTTKKCWGYENDCAEEHRMASPECDGDAGRWAKTKEGQIENFWTSADFGYVKKRLGELRYMCEPTSPDDSSLKCAKNTIYCYGTNVYMDFRESNFSNSTNKYREDMFKKGEIGGSCKMYPDRLREGGDHKSALQSWYAELQEFTALPFHPLRSNKCNIVLDKPTIVMKLDAGVNMYHHFCDFVNLYVAQHINNTFSTDVNIIMWDTARTGYGDLFRSTWKAFTDYPIVHLKEYDGKKVCFRDLMFALLPRMRYGLYYSMTLIPGCQKSSMFRAFSQHVLHRLNVEQEGPLRNKIRITLLSRGSKYRNILNEKELVNGLKTVRDYEVNLVRYDRKMPFIEQLKVTHNSDIFIGMHGAGLTHLLFQPDWGVIFELYNCEDDKCYRDLARLRGMYYMTWEKKDKLIQEDEGHHPELGAHAKPKSKNYSFELREFLRLVEKAANHVRDAASYKKAWKQRYGTKDEL